MYFGSGIYQIVRKFNGASLMDKDLEYEDATFTFGKMDFVKVREQWSLEKFDTLKKIELKSVNTPDKVFCYAVPKGEGTLDVVWGNKGEQLGYIYDGPGRILGKDTIDKTSVYVRQRLPYTFDLTMLIYKADGTLAGEWSASAKGGLYRDCRPGYSSPSLRQMRTINSSKSIGKTVLKLAGFGIVGAIAGVAFSLFQNTLVNNARNKVDRLKIAWKPVGGKEMPIDIMLREDDVAVVGKTLTWAWSCPLFDAHIDATLFNDNIRIINLKPVVGVDPTVALMISFLTVYIADPFGIKAYSDSGYPPKAGEVDPFWHMWPMIALEDPLRRTPLAPNAVIKPGMVVADGRVLVEVKPGFTINEVLYPDNVKEPGLDDTTVAGGLSNTVKGMLMSHKPPKPDSLPPPKQQSASPPASAGSIKVTTTPA